MDKLVRTVLLFLLAHACRAASCQTRPTAEKDAEVSLFFAPARIATPYTTTTQPGFTAGADYTRFLHRYSLAVSLETRTTYTPVRAIVGARDVSGGLRLESTHFRRLRPYADLLAGGGQVDFASHPDAHDRAFTITYGGGLDLALFRGFSTKVDAQSTRWDLAPTNIPHRSAFGLGMLYRLPTRDPLAR